MKIRLRRRIPDEDLLAEIKVIHGTYLSTLQVTFHGRSKAEQAQGLTGWELTDGDTLWVTGAGDLIVTNEDDAND